jgi:hypothetical protein
MSTKKFGIVAGIAIALSVVVSPAFAACSLTTMSECDNAGLMTLIAQMLSGSQTQTQTTTTGAAISGIPAGFTFATNLKQGSTGNDVKYLQVLLNSNTATAIGNSGKETTYFGAATKAAVVKFQNKFASEVLTPYGLKAGTGFFGTATRNKANAMIASGTTTTTTGGTTTTTTTPTTGAYTVALAANQPVATLAAGSAYNTMLKINVSAGTTAQTITSVTVQRTGLTSDNKVAGVLVADENGARHGDIVTFASGVATISFTADPITVAAGTTKTISIQYNTDSTASGTVGATVTAMTGTPAGLPLVGNTVSVVTGTIGSVQVDSVQLSSSAVSKDVGSTGYEIAKFKFAAGANEDILVKKVTVYQNGNSSDTDVSNIRLVAPDGTVLSTVASATNKYVTFDLTASPYKIAKGNVKDLVVRIDIANGSSRTVQYVIQNDYDVIVTGSSTGVNVLPVAGGSGMNDTTFPVGDASGNNTVSINAGSLIVQKATTTPSGTIAIGGSNITLATWKFQARGEDIEVRKIKAFIGGLGIADSNLTLVALSGTVRLVTEDGQVLATIDPTTAGLVKLGTNATGYTITLASYYTVAAGTTKNISLVVDTASTLASTATLYGSISDIYYKQTSTNAFATANASSVIAGNTLSASGASLTAVKNSSLGNSSKVAGQSNVKIGSYLLQASSTEGVNVSTIAVALKTGSNSSYLAFGTAPVFSNLTLKKSDGTVLGSSIGSPTVGNGTSFGAANSFSVSGSLNVPASSTVQVDVYVDLPTALAGYLTTEIDALGISATGVSSGVSANAPTSAQTGQVIAVVAGGTLTVAEETSGAASSQFLSTGLSGVELGKIKFAATVEDMKIDRLEIRTINGAGNLSQIKLLGTGLTTDPTTVLTGSTAVFTFPSGSELTVPAYGSRVLTIAADTTNVGTIIPGSLIAVGFGTANAKGAGSGNTVEETVTGANKVAGTDTYTGTAGDVIYFTAIASGANVTPGYYMVTTATAGDLVANGLFLNGNGTATRWVSGDNVVLLSGTADVVDGSNHLAQSYAAGDVVYVYTASTADTDGFYTVTSAVTGGATTATTASALVSGITLAQADRVTKITSVNALVSNIMKAEEVEPTITKDGSSPSGTTSASSDQIVAMFDVKAEGSRDLSFSRLTVEKGGSQTPDQNVSHLSLYNGSTKLAEVLNTTITATIGTGVASATQTFTNLGITTDAQLASINVGDTLRIIDHTASDALLGTVAVNSLTGTTTAISGKETGVTGVILSSSITTVTGHVIYIYNNRVHFDGYSDVVLPTQSITAGQTMVLTVKADTTSVKTGATSGQTVTFTASIPGSAGPLVTTVGGLNWSYTALYNSATRSSNKADNYPVSASTLSY